MSAIEDVLQRITTITFDCYGTLIDWAGGLAKSFEELLGPAAADRMEEIFAVYVRYEAQIEAESFCSYREILARVARKMADHFHVDLPPQRAELLAEMLPTWPPFPDTNEALKRLKKKCRLGILSNIDRDLLAATSRQFDIDFDFVVTAQDVESYKPAHGHFERLLAQHAQRDKVLHVAQSLFHDGAPAGDLGIAYVWINRYNETNDTDVRPLATYPDLASLAK